MKEKLIPITNSVSLDAKVVYIYQEYKGWTFIVDPSVENKELKKKSYSINYKTKTECIENCVKLFKEYGEDLTKKIKVRNEYSIKSFPYVRIRRKNKEWMIHLVSPEIKWGKQWDEEMRDIKYGARKDALAALSFWRNSHNIHPLQPA